jgi:hypothetical protein
MHKTLRFVIVSACLVSTVGLGPMSARSKSSARGTTSAAVAAVAVQSPPPLVASPSQFYQYDTEEFVNVSGGALGSASTVVTYTNGSTVLSVEPQINSANPQLNEVWVPVEVTNTLGHWDVRVLATDSSGVTTTYGPASLDIVEQPPVVLPLALPEVLVVDVGSAFTFDANGASCNYDSGTTLALGTTQVTCTLNGETESFLVVTTDSTPPVLTLPGDIATLDTTVTFEATAVDNLDGPVPVTCTPTSGSTFANGDTVVRCDAQDAHLNDAAGKFLVTVGPPVFSLPNDITVEAVGPAGNVVSYVATVGSGTIQCAPASGALFPVATTTVNCSASNAVASSTASFNVSVVDTTPPSLTVSSDMTVNTSNSGGIAVTYTATSTDIVDGNVPVICSTPSGATFPVGTTTVQCSATDAHNNTTNGSFNVTVVYTPPMLTAVSPHVWLGLKDASKDKGALFDLLVEVLRDGSVIGSGQTNSPAVGPGFGNAANETIAVALAGSPIVAGDTLSVRVSARIAANSPLASATARLWTNDAEANSGMSVTIQGVTTNYFLLPGSVLGAVGSGPKVPLDVTVSRNVGGNAFVPFGVWTVQY